MQSVRPSSRLSDDLCSPEYSSRSSSRRYDDLDVLSSRHSRQLDASLRSFRQPYDDLYDAVDMGGSLRRRDSDVPLGQSRLSSDDLDGLEYPGGSSQRHQLRSLEFSREQRHTDSASYRIHGTQSLYPLSDNRPPVDDRHILEYSGDMRADHRSANSSRSFDDHIMEMEYSYSLNDSHNESSPRKYRDSSSPRRYRDSSLSERYPDRREYEENRRKLHYDENELTRVKPYDLTERRRAVRSGSFSPPRKERVPVDVDYRQPDWRHDVQNSDRRVLYERGDGCSELDSNKERLLPNDYRKREEINLLKAKIKQMQEEKSLGGLRSDHDISALAEALQPALMEEIAKIEAMEQKADSTHTLKMMDRETADVDPVKFDASARPKDRDERNNDTLSQNELQPDLRYELISEFGESSNNMYTVQVTVDDRIFFGTGSTIQLAKSEARKKALLQMVNLMSPAQVITQEASSQQINAPFPAVFSSALVPPQQAVDSQGFQSLNSGHPSPWMQQRIGNQIPTAPVPPPQAVITNALLPTPVPPPQAVDSQGFQLLDSGHPSPWMQQPSVNQIPTATIPQPQAVIRNQIPPTPVPPPQAVTTNALPPTPVPPPQTVSGQDFTPFKSTDFGAPPPLMEQSFGNQINSQVPAMVQAMPKKDFRPLISLVPRPLMSLLSPQQITAQQSGESEDTSVSTEPVHLEKHKASEDSVVPDAKKRKKDEPSEIGFEKWQLHMDIFNRKPLKHYGLKINEPNTQAVVKIIQILKEMNKAMDIPTLKVILFGVCSKEMKEAVGKDDRALTSFIARFGCLFGLKQGKVHLVDKHLQWHNLKENEKWELDLEVLTHLPLSRYIFNSVRTYALVELIETVKNHSTKLTLESLYQIFLRRCSQGMKYIVAKDAQMFKHFLTGHSLIFRLYGSENGVHMRMDYLKWNIVPLTSGDRQSSIDRIVNKVIMQRNGWKQIQTNEKWKLNVKVLSQKPLLHYKTSGINKTRVLVKLIETLKNSDRTLSVKTLATIVFSDFTKEMKKVAGGDEMGFKNFLSRHSLLFYLSGSDVFLLEEHLKWHVIPITFDPSEIGFEKWQLHMDIFNKTPLKHYGLKINEPNTQAVVKIRQILKEMNKAMDIPTLKVILFGVCSKEMKEAVGKDDQDVTSFIARFGCLFDVKHGKVNLVDKHLQWHNETKVIGSAKFYNCELDTDVFLQKPLNSLYQLELSEPGTQALVKIIQILKENNRPIHFATLTIMLNWECTQEMKDAVGKTSQEVKKFLGKFGLLFTLEEDMVSLVDKYLKWKNLSIKNESSSKKDGSSSIQDKSSSRKDESSSRKDASSSVKNAGKKYILDIGSSLTSKVLACLPDALALNVLVSTMEMLKNAKEPLGAEDWSKHFISKDQENLFKTPSDFQEFLYKFPSLFNVADNVMQLKDEGLHWIEVPELDSGEKSELHKQKSYQELTGQSDVKWELDLANSYMPKAYHKMSDQGARELVVVIIEELKRRKCVSHITNILNACILLNPWCTKRMKDALGSTQSIYTLNTFLSKFPFLFSIMDLNVSLKDKCLSWTYYFDGMLIVKTSGSFNANRKAIMYFRNRIYDVRKLLLKESTIAAVSYRVFNTFVDSASDDIKICVGKLEDCWLNWLLKHSFIFKVDTDKRMITLKEMFTPIVDNSLSLYFEDYRKLMLVRELILLKGNLPFDELYDCFNIRKVQNLFSDYPKNDFHSLIKRNSDFFTIDSKEIVSVCESTPIVFISGVYPFAEPEREYVGHGKLKLVYDSWAVMDVGGTNIEDVYIDKTCFRLQIKSFRSCMEVGNWFSFSAFQVAKKKNIDMKWKSKWKASSIWTLHETCEQLGLKFKKIEENSP